MASEASSGPQPGERVSDQGLILPPERTGNIRETITFANLSKRSDTYNSPGVDPQNPYNAFAQTSAELADEEPAGVEDQPQSPEDEALTTQVLKQVVADLESQTARNQALEAKIAELEARLDAVTKPGKEIELFEQKIDTGKQLADEQPRRVRQIEGINEKLVKYADGSFEWIPIEGPSTKGVASESGIKIGQEEATTNGPKAIETALTDSTDIVAGEPGSEGEALEGESQEEYELRMAMEAATRGEGGDDGSLEDEQSSSEFLEELNARLQEAQDKYAEATAKHRNGFMGHLLHNSRFIVKIPVIGALLKTAADKLNDAQDKILLGPARAEYTNAIVAIQNEIKNQTISELGDGPESIESIRMQASDIAIQSDVQLEMKIAASRMERSGKTNNFVNWWVRQNGLGGKFLKAGVIVGAGLTAGALLGLAGAPIVGAAFGAGMGASVGVYATKKRASAITEKGGSETLAQKQSREDTSRKEAYAQRQKQAEDGFVTAADLVSMTEDRTGNEKVGNRKRVKAAAGAGAIGASAGASIGSAIRAGIENAAGPTPDLNKGVETAPVAPGPEVIQHGNISILDNEGGTEAVQRLYGATEDQARAIWDEVFSKLGTNPLDHASVGGPDMPDIIQLPSGSYGWSHEGWLSDAMTKALNEAAIRVIGA